jgi:hypothetical protein
LLWRVERESPSRSKTSALRSIVNSVALAIITPYRLLVSARVVCSFSPMMNIQKGFWNIPKSAGYGNSLASFK